MSIVSPKDLLLPYQRKWVDDKSRFKMGLMARQTGKSFSCTGEAVEDSILNPKTPWVAISAGERQALELLRKAKEWAEAYKYQIENYAEDRDSAQALVKSAEITWSNGSRLIALPANPETARGYSANLILDEFAFHEKPDEIWRAIYPSISNPLRGVFKIRIVSTANGKGNKFYDLWTKNSSYSKHLVTIYDAVAQGLPLNIEELKAGLDDPEGWAQEYECQFIDTAAILLPYELIALCESPEATEAIAFEFFHPTTTRGPLFLGIDFGRKRDLTVAYTLEKVGDVLWTREVLVLAGLSSPAQEEILRPRIAAAARTCFDYTGPGVGLGDYLVEVFGEWKPDQHKFGKIELCTFTNALKQEIFPKLRMKFDQRLLRVPISRTLREDLHAIHRVVSSSGLITYKAPHTEDGHSDRATGLALAVRAAEAPVTVGTIRTFGGRRAAALRLRSERSVAG
jgi:phage FluMu gp28-like protein